MGKRTDSKIRFVSVFLSALLGLTGAAQSAPPTIAEVVKTYADIAHAAYQDSAESAKDLQAAINIFLETPSEQTLAEAKAAWLLARVPYQQTEVFRFGNAIVDDWEGRVNAWPLDEGLIDYVSRDYGETSDENELYVSNVIANQSLKINGRTIDISNITKTLISKMLHEAGGIEANVASGYHAIEFLLWGQDLNGTGAGAGKRPASDYDVQNCTAGHCARRGKYLQVVTALLVDDLTWMVGEWGPEGKARQALSEDGGTAGLIALFTGMGSLSYGELAGERMKLGLLLHDPEEEHDCFSDNTHNSHYYDALGIQNVYLGRYKRLDGSEIKGPSAADLLADKAPRVGQALGDKLAETVASIGKIVDRAEQGEAYDQLIGEGNEAGNRLIANAIEALLTQTKAIERAIAALDLKQISLQGSDSLNSAQ